MALAAMALAPLALLASSERTYQPEAVATFGAIGVDDDEPADTMAGLEIRFVQNWNGIRPWLGLNAVDNGTVFAGAGLVYDFHPSQDWVISIGSGPFYYTSNRHDLGLDLEFYSFIEGTYRLANDSRLGLRVGHLSNAGLGRVNPGTENVQLVFVIPLTREREKAQRAHDLAFSRF
jgi:hypothetical protein